jgi:predicted DNA-binding transcriptional regulator AlpA
MKTFADGRTRELVQFPETAGLVGREANQVTRLYLLRQIKAGTFPAPLQLSPGRIAWRRSEVEAWIASRPRVKYAAEAGTGATAKGGTK